MSFPKPFYRWRPHPWHGLEVGPNPPSLVYAYIEITPFDSIKYEIEKTTGYLIIDRPQRTSSQPPMPYGFIPRTFCGERVRALAPKAQKGDGDPLDICVISERPITRGDIILKAQVVGGLQMIDDDEADDKIVAILEKDTIWGREKQMEAIPDIYVERLHHYFSTYKMKLGEAGVKTHIEMIYGREHALEVVKAAMADYDDEYGQ